MQRLFEEVIKTYDCTIICGHRTVAEQSEHLKNGTTKVKHSKHNETPAQAVEVSPYPIPENWSATDFKERARFYHFAGFVKGVAETLKIPIRWAAIGMETMTFQTRLLTILYIMNLRNQPLRAFFYERKIKCLNL